MSLHQRGRLPLTLASWLAIATCAVLLTASPGANGAVAQHFSIATVDKVRETEFFTYDLTGRLLTHEQVDWAVDLLFVNASTVNRVKSKLNKYYEGTGSRMFAGVRDSGKPWVFDDDKGRKSTEKLIPINPFHNVFHYRIYAPNPPDSMFARRFGHFNIATTHIDHDEGTSGEWFGLNEKAERKIATAWEHQVSPYMVGLDQYWLGNEEFREEKEHLWENDGKASILIVLDPSERPSGGAS